MAVTATLICKEVCAWPNLIRLADGRIAAVIFNRPSHGLEEGSLELWCADTQGTSWAYTSTPCPNLPEQNRMHMACGVTGSGDIHILSSGFLLKDKKFVQLMPLWHSLSRDGGYTWSIKEDLSVDGLDHPCIPHGTILEDQINKEDKSNRILATVYLSHGKDNPSNTWLIESLDGGANWAVHSQIGSGDTNEACLATLAAGRGGLMAAVRTHIDHHTRLYSLVSDKGSDTSSWQDNGALTLPMQHPGHLLRIGKSGILLSYGIRNKGLMAIGGRYSDNDGKTWSAPFIIHQFPEGATDCGYPSSLHLGDGLIITGFYTNLSMDYEGYQFGVLHYHLSDFLEPRQLKSISDGREMQI